MTPALRALPSADTTPSARQLPHNIEAEQALIGALLISNEALERVSDFLLAEHFYDPLHGQIYETMAKLIQAGKQATPVTVKTFFETAEPINAQPTVPQYLGRLAVNATTIINARDYGRTIYDLAVRRGLIAVGENLVNVAYDSPVDASPEEQIREAEGALYALAEQGKYGKGSQSIASVWLRVVHEADDAYRNGPPATLKTGFVDIDRTVQIESGDLVILAGRPAMGKTSLATRFAYNIAKSGTGVQFDSLEMKAEQVGRRLLGDLSGIEAIKLKNGTLSEDDFRSVEQVRNSLIDLPLWIDDTGGLSIDRIVARARRIKRQRGIGCLVIDYLQLVHGSRYRNDGRVQEVTEITTGLKALAKDLNVPIIALSQLSRKCEERDDKRPQLADLRDSGSIEQDADVVMFVFREEHYIERDRPTDTAKIGAWQQQLMACRGKAEVIIAKNRNGACCKVELAFEPTLTRFSNLVSDGATR